MDTTQKATLLFLALGMEQKGDTLWRKNLPDSKYLLVSDRIGVAPLFNQTGPIDIGTYAPDSAWESSELIEDGNILTVAVFVLTAEWPSFAGRISVSDDNESIGISAKGYHIVSPFESCCRRFQVDPETEWEIPSALAGKLVAVNEVISAFGEVPEQPSSPPVSKALEAALSPLPVWQMTIPVLATGHLMLETVKKLEADGDSNPWCYCAAYKEGFFLSVPSESGEFPDPQPPADLLAVWQWARARGFSWVRLDGIGVQTDDLPSYDW